MRTAFIETANYREFLEALTRVDDRGARETCMVVVDGKPGLGKTETMRRWVTQTGSLYLRAQMGWDYNWFVRSVLTELGVRDHPRGRDARFELALDLMGRRAEAASEIGRVWGFVVDECDLVSRNEQVMEGIRAFSDLQEMPTVLVGMGKLRDSLRRFSQIESRAPNKVEFKPLQLEDAAALIRGLCEVPVADDLVTLVWKLSRGFSREIVDATKVVERFGFRIDPGPQGVTVADMAGQPIMNNRETGQQIVVPGVA